MDINRFLNFKDKWQLTKDVAIWFLSGLILLFVGKLLGNLLGEQLKLFSPYIINPPETISVAGFFLLLVLLFILIKNWFYWVNIYRNKNKIYQFNSKDWPDKWLFHGKSELIDDAYLFVKSSRAGCLLNNYYWKDFKMSFEMKFKPDNFRNQKLISLIFRADDLDNYFMIEIGESAEYYLNPVWYTKDINKEDTKGIDKFIFVSSIKPHVRYKGGWEIMSVEEITPPFDFSDFVKISLAVKDDTVRLFYKNNPIFSWILPTHVDVNHIESGVEDNREKTKEILVGGSFAGHVQKIPFRLGYGLVGFRAHLKHGAIVRNFKVKPL